MSYLIVELIVIVLLILGNALFAMSEMAVISSRRVRLQQQADRGSEGARAAFELAHAPTVFLSTVQIGITLIGILTGAFGGTTIAGELARLLSRIRLLAPYSSSVSIGLVVLIITYLSLVLGELVPKRLALSNPERIASAVAPWMRMLSAVASPFVRLLSLSTEMVLRVLRVHSSAEMPVTEEEIKLLIEQGTQVGVFEPTEQAMIERVFRLDDRSVSALMTPRTDVIWLDLNVQLENICSTVIANGHSCFPVAQDDLDDVIGIVHAKDLLAQSLQGQPVDVRAVIHPALFVPEGMSALDVLEQFKQSHSHLAIVIDEYGGTQGLITINDLMRAIVGDIPSVDERAEPDIIRREDGSWLLDGKLSVDEIKELLGVKQLPFEDTRFYQTLGGMIMAFLQRVPSSSDYFEWDGMRFEVVDMDGRRVDKVLVAPAHLSTTEEDRPDFKREEI